MFLNKINCGTYGRHLPLPFQFQLSLLMPLVFTGEFIPCSLSTNWTVQGSTGPGQINDPGLNQPVRIISPHHSQGSEVGM